MKLFGRRPAPVAARLDTGFWVAEAPALQTAIRNALGVLPRGEPPVRAEVTFGPGSAGRVVVILRNQNVGFVPDERSVELLQQLAAAGRAPLTSPAEVHRQEGEWRIWAGPPWPADQRAPAYPAAQIAPAPQTIFGFQLRTPPPG